MDLLDNIKAEAISLGFPLFGVSNIRTPPHYAAYVQWVKDCKHASMHYLSRTDALLKRKSPELLMPSAQSMLVLGCPYQQDSFDHLTRGWNTAGRISSYALVPDYHEVIPEKLEILVSRITRMISHEFEYRIYTDTGPILEKDFGMLSGLGWVGKNSSLISPTYGSYFFLAEILLPLQLEATKPFQKDFCGRCNRCVDACPTQCIGADRTIDAAKCISFLTIENKGKIPRHLRSQISTWIFGCDICQEICPWNKKKKKTPGQSLFRPYQNSNYLELQRLLFLSEDQFRLEFKGTPLMRAKRKGLLRNALCVLGNIKNPESIQWIDRFLESEKDPMLREHAYWALGQMQTKDSRSVLKAWYQKEFETEVRTEIELSLAEQAQ